MLKIPKELSPKHLNFRPLSTDYIFKSLWLNGTNDTKEYFYRLINRIVGYDIKDYTFFANELPINKNNGINNKVDFLLVSKDQSRKINIELNRVYYKSLMNRNESYLYKIAGNFYTKKTKDEYDKKLLIDQINLNCFKSPNDKAITISEFTMKDNINNLDLKSIRIINIYIPTLSMSCYNNDKEEQLDYKMFLAQSFKEMEEIAKGNKERMSVMKDLRRMMIEDENYDTDEDRIALGKAIEREIRANAKEEGKEEGRKEGIYEGRKQGIDEGRKQGINEGRQEGENNIINKLLSSGMSKKELSKRLNIPISNIKV